MTLFQVSTIACLLFTLPIHAFSRAEPAVQRFNSRSVYQGGWPLALVGSGSPSCPAEASVSCSSTDVNPSCCPSGQTCIWGPSEFANYCCPTSADCNTAVLNFPACANTTWNMFAQKPDGFFCCEPGQIGVNPASGTPGGLCEAADQIVPTSLLATIISQVVTPTAKPSALVTGNATATASGTPLETNPTVPNTSNSSEGENSGSGSTGGNVFSNLSVRVKVGIAFGVVFVILILAVGTRSAYRRRSGYVPATRYEYGTTEYESYGTALQQGYRPSYASQPYGGSQGNNVTVNVVHGDQQT